MSWLKKLFGKQAKQKVTNTSQSYIEIRNSYGWGDGTPLFVEANPHLEHIFTEPNPPNPQRLSNTSPDSWEKADLKYKRIPLAIAYLQHPEPKIRKFTLNFIKDIDAAIITEVLANLFADEDYAIRMDVAKTIWERQSHVNCKYMVNTLKDEIEYPGAILGRENAQSALNMLVHSAPNEKAKSAIKSLIEDDH